VRLYRSVGLLGTVHRRFERAGRSGARLRAVLKRVEGREGAGCQRAGESWLDRSSRAERPPSAISAARKAPSLAWVGREQGAQTLAASGSLSRSAFDRGGQFYSPAGSRPVARAATAPASDRNLPAFSLELN
jgi:hypothetical protein